jgi:oxygen-independent coproporphyrinogen-3 oxidase
MEGTRNKTEEIGTIYLGGGTPSQLTIGQLHQLTETIHRCYWITPDAETTIECNPDDVTADYAQTLCELGFNRVSMGAQTFDNQRLRFLHRRHQAEQVQRAVRILRKAGIQNISIDLMYGFPEETIDDWQRDIDAALALDVEHLSAYCLMVEEGTSLYRQIESGEVRWREEEELERQMYYLLIDRLKAAGYEHYELSNFARPGRRSRHNSSYWTDTPYIGLGAAAHSYDGKRRYWNIDNLQHYIEGVENGNPTHEEELMDDDCLYNDRIMLSFRTCEGLNLTTLCQRDKEYLLPLTKKYLDEGLLVLTDNHLRLSREGLFVSDMIMSDLMRVTDNET